MCNLKFLQKLKQTTYKVNYFTPISNKLYNPQNLNKYINYKYFFLKPFNFDKHLNVCLNNHIITIIFRIYILNSFFISYLNTKFYTLY